MIRVLVVDDSAVLRQSTRFILESDPDLQVIGEAGDGLEALSQVERLRPDVITMDLRMPKIDGLEAIRRIMSARPAPIVVVTGIDLERESRLSREATRLGAVSILKRPDVAAPDFRTFAAKLIEQVKLMSAVKVIRRMRATKPLDPDNVAPPVINLPPAQRIGVVAIGASTGGPAALHRILGALRADYPAPILIVQHIAFGFIDGLARWLGEVCPLPVKVAYPAESIQPGNVYLAPDNFHLLVDRTGRIQLSDRDPLAGHRPSVTLLFNAVAQAYGPAALGVLLTGMGADGAAGLKALRQAGAITIAQDQASCVVFGMPKEAIVLDAATHVLALDHIAETIQALVAQSGAKGQV